MIMCPKCGSPTTVTETRTVQGGSRRRRRCESIVCNERVTTMEFVVTQRNTRPMLDVAVVRERDLRKLQELVGHMTSGDWKSVNEPTGDPGES